jgi:hypothetical protein
VEHLLSVGEALPSEYARLEKTLKEQQKDSWFSWTKNPKDLLVTLSACFAASLAQEWIQECTGNLDWPSAFNVQNDPWILGAVNSILWFSAATGGAIIADALQNKFVGRRLSLVFAACFSLAGSIASSRSQSWQGMMVARVFLGIGVGKWATVFGKIESLTESRGKIEHRTHLRSRNPAFQPKGATFVFLADIRELGNLRRCRCPIHSLRLEKPSPQRSTSSPYAIDTGSRSI